MRGAQWIFCCFLVVVTATTVHGAAFFVDADLGDDSNPGTSAALPFRTIQRAINAAAAQPGPDMIQLAEGTYNENLTISDADELTLSGGSVVVVAADASKDVIKITRGDVSLSEVTITGGNRGITPTGSAGKPVSLSLRGVVVTANKGDGVRATSVIDIRASQCTFLENGGTGIRVQTADGVTISHCTFETNGGRGLRAEDVKSVTVSHCQILNNEDDGVKVVTVALDRTESNLSIRDTTISGSADDGIDLELLGDIRLTNVTVQDTLGDDGMSIDDSVSVSVIDSTFTNSSADGLDMDDTQSIRLVDVASTGNGGSGFQVKAEDLDIESVSIVGSEFSSNGEDGIQIAEEDAVVFKVTLTNLTARNNVESGLDIDITGTLRLTNIISEDNGEPDKLP